MRTWRVGTFSMGASLILLGLFLFFSKMIGMDLVHIMTAWWPVILVVLGIEILLSLFLSKQEKPFIKYDFLSIFFVGILGTVGIAFAIVSSTGLLGKFEEMVAREEKTFELPGFSYHIDEKIHRIVVRTVNYPVTIETTSESEVSMVGTYRTQTTKKEQPLKNADDYIVADKKGDTLYVNVKIMPNEMGPFSSSSEIAGTLLIPDNVKLEVIGNDNSITLKPRTIKNNWSINHASEVLLDVAQDSNLKVAAEGVQEVDGKEGKWKVTEKPEPNPWKEATFQSGTGQYHINIANTYHVNLNMAE